MLRKVLFYMTIQEISPQLQKMINGYKYVKDTEGMSPAKVYKLIGEQGNLYLKMTDSRYQGTTYDVEREKDMMLWLEGKLSVPEVIHFEHYNGWSCLLMSEMEGVVASTQYGASDDAELLVKQYATSIHLLQSIDLADCPFDNSVNNRLAELAYLLDNQLADIDATNWEEDTEFGDPKQLYQYLQSHQPQEELVFSHGDLGDSNFLVLEQRVSGFIDLGRSGKADKWYDIAFCVRSIREDFGDEKYIDMFFDLLGIEPNWEKIKYFILLDELF